MAGVVLPKSVYQGKLGLRITSDTTTLVNPIARSVQFAFGPSASADATATLQNDGTVIRIVPGNRGNDYVKPPFVRLNPIVPTAAQLQAFLRLNSFTINNGGTGYVAAPTVRLIGGLPPAQKDFLGCVRTVFLQEPGLGYPSNTTCTIVGGGPAGPGAPPTRQATAVPTVDSFGRIMSLTLTDMGAGYTRIPEIAFRSHGTQPKKVAKAFCTMAAGTPALAHATVALGIVTGVILDSAGEGYVDVPEVVLTGAHTTPAIVTPRLELDRVDVLFKGAGYPQVGTTVVFTPYFKKLYPDGGGQDKPFFALFKAQFRPDARTPVIAAAPVLA